MRQSVRFFSILITIATFFSSNLLSQEVTGIDERGKDRRVYWFNVNISFKTDPVTGVPLYDTRIQSKKVYYGSLEKFDHTLWKGLGAGSRLCVGPFSVYDEAYQAMALYDTKHETAPIDTSYDKSRQVHYFLLFIGRRERSGSYFLPRQPAAVNASDYEGFYDALKVALQSGGGDLAKVAIGPFWEHIDAEEAKRQYRQH